MHEPLIKFISSIFDVLDDICMHISIIVIMIVIQVVHVVVVVVAVS